MDPRNTASPHNVPQSTPGSPKAISPAHVVYDGRTGVILHVHFTVEFAGGARQSESAPDRARRMAGAAPGAALDVQVIEVDPAEVNHRQPIRVDLATHRVVAQ